MRKVLSHFLASTFLLILFLGSVCSNCQPFGKAIVLKGTVLRAKAQDASVSHSSPVTEPTKDALVSLCSVIREQDIDLEFTALASTVSDSDGNYELIMDNLDPEKLYAIRARAPGDVWSTAILGKGSQVAEWTLPANILVGQTPSALTFSDEEISKSKERIKRLNFKVESSKHELQSLEEQVQSQSGAVGGSSTEKKKLEAAKEQQLVINRQRQAELERQSALESQKVRLTASAGTPQFGTESVLFVTDRAITGTSASPMVANSENVSGTLSFGVCTVAVERQAKMADELIRLIVDRDADRFYSVQRVSISTAEEFWSQFESEKNANPTHDALLFIHGFNSSFDDACRRAAQIAYDIKFRGPILLYSWPSRDSLFGYAADEETSEWSTPHFKEFLSLVLSQKGIGRLHIIAHSMGNRILINSLFFGKIAKEEQSHLGQIILAAPDVNRMTFDQQVALKRIKVQRISMYCSGRDQALKISKILHGYSRVGDSLPDIDVKAGMDSIDATAVDTMLLGHSYIGAARSVLVDVAALIGANTRPDDRFGLFKMGQAPKQWWVLNP